MHPLFAKIWNTNTYLSWACIGLVSLVTFVLMWGSVNANLTLSWQNMYRVEEFTSWGQLGTFLEELQTAISPFWSALEISAQLLFGSAWIFTKLGYVLWTVFAFAISIKLFGTSRSRLLIITSLCLVFAVAIRVIHKGNPQLYDIYTPVLFLLFLFSLKRARQTTSSIVPALMAGLFLSIFELTRSFVFPMLPVLIVLGLISLAGKPWRAKLLFILPLILLSGSWHLKQVVVHQQLHWSNLTGYNLQKSWEDFLEVKFPNLKTQARYPGGFPNLNTKAQTEYNKVIVSTLVRKISEQPAKAVARVGECVIQLYQPKTDLYLAKMGRIPKLIYRPLVWLTGLSLLAGFLVLAYRLLRGIRRKSTWLALGDPENILVIGLVMISLLLAIGERGEEARFMVSMLPLLAAMPGWELYSGKIATAFRSRFGGKA